MGMLLLLLLLLTGLLLLLLLPVMLLLLLLLLGMLLPVAVLSTSRLPLDLRRLADLLHSCRAKWEPGVRGEHFRRTLCETQP